MYWNRNLGRQKFANSSFYVTARVLQEMSYHVQFLLRLRFSDLLHENFGIDGLIAPLVRAWNKLSIDI